METNKVLYWPVLDDPMIMLLGGRFFKALVCDTSPKIGKVGAKGGKTCCQAQPQLQLNWAELALMSISPSRLPNTGTHFYPWSADLSLDAFGAALARIK